MSWNARLICLVQRGDIKQEGTIFVESLSLVGGSNAIIICSYSIKDQFIKFEEKIGTETKRTDLPPPRA